MNNPTIGERFDRWREKHKGSLDSLFDAFAAGFCEGHQIGKNERHTGECFSAPGPCPHGDEITCKGANPNKTLSGPVLEYAKQKTQK